VRQRIQNAFDGLGWPTGIAVVLIVFSVLTLLLISQSSFDRLQWTGARVIGNEQQGLVFYTYKGQRNSLDVKGFATNPHYVVYVDRSDPSTAEADSRGTRGLDAGFVLGPLVLAAVSMSLGVTRRRRQRRGDRSGGTDRNSGFGQGLDDDFVKRKLDELRGNEP
jgi:hypothetical protein